MEDNPKRIRINHLTHYDLLALEYDLEINGNEVESIPVLFKRKYKQVSMIDKYREMFKNKDLERLDLSEHEKLIDGFNHLMNGDIDYIDFWSDDVYIYSMVKNGEYFDFTDSNPIYKRV